MKTKSAITGKFVSKKAAEAKPKTTFAVNDYSTRMLRKLIRLWDSEYLDFNVINALVDSIKKKMGWK